MITIRLFGMLKAMVGVKEALVLDLADGANVKDLVELLSSRYPELGELVVKKKVLVSVNREVAHWETAISRTDEIALLPPFAGGSCEISDFALRLETV